MGLLLKEGIDFDLIKTALLAFLSIGFLMFLINLIPIFKKRLNNYSLQLAGLIGNTSFLGIPIAIALLPTKTINFTIGFDLGTTLFAWIFGPFFLKKQTEINNNLNLKELSNALLNSPASRGVIGVLVLYFLKLDVIVGNFLWIPARIVIVLAIIVVGTRLGIITNNKTKIFILNKGTKYALFLKLIIFPLIIFIISKYLDFNPYQTSAVVLQAGTPTAISTILMGESYKINQEIAAKILFATTLLSIFTIPILNYLINVDYLK